MLSLNSILDHTIKINYTKLDNVLHIKSIFIKLKKNVAGRKTASYSAVEYKTPYKKNIER